MTEKIIIAGAGGQGVMLLGKILAQSALREDKYVTWFPSYGAEVRGGSAYCMVIISSQEIGSPYIDKADTLIIMNALSLKRFKSRIKNKGLLIINDSLVKQNLNTKSRVLKYSFTDIALKLGNIKVANTVALGCYLAKTKSIKPESVIKAIEEIAPADKKHLIEINKKALFAGMELITPRTQVTKKW